MPSYPKNNVSAVTKMKHKGLLGSVLSVVKK